ncbi:MAG: hypothetical protein AB7K71_27270 [Polyangiaceae bacterium]
MSDWSLVVGAALGALGGTLHLLLTRWRADQIRAQRATLILVTYPLGIAIPAVCVLCAAAIARPAAWAAAGSLAALHVAWLALAARRLERR